MSFIGIVRDYVDLLSSNSSSTLKIGSVAFEAFVSFVHYVLTFGWIRDIIYLPVTLPFLQDSVLSGRFFPDDINFLDEGLKCESFWPLFILGFANSFFCCLPLSTSHFLSLRRLFVQGLLAGVTSTIGGLLGQCFFLGCTLFGFRAFVIPWFSLDPLNYVTSFILLFLVIYEMSNEKRIRPINISEKNVLKKIFLLSFFLSWTEQSCFFQYLRNLTLGTDPTILEGFSNVNYFFGLILGHIFFNFFFVFLSLNVKKAFFRVSKVPYSIWLKKINFFFLSVTLGLTLTSVPYYSFDYLLGSPLGFISQDKFFSNSIFAQNEIEDKNLLLTSLDGVFPFTIDTDISYFDRGNSGDQPGFFQKNFEELNYQGEYAWTSRRDKKPNLYTSGQTTKTTILDFFQGKLDKEEEVESSVEPMVRIAPSKLADLPQSNGKDRQKFKKRYFEQEENRDSNGFLLAESFSTFPLYNDLSVPAIEKSIKKKFYSNPIYQTLLHSEIDSYLTRSSDNILSVEEESDLFSKRKLLSAYGDTIRPYKKVPYQDEFQEFFQGSKSYVDRAYHHQFKGNLKVVSKYFTLSWNQDSLESDMLLDGQEDSILTYDQALFLSNDVPEHEELDLLLVDNLFLEVSESIPFYLGYAKNSGQGITTLFGGDSKVSRGPSPNWQRWPVSKDRLVKMEQTGDSSVVTLFHSTSNPEIKSVLSQVSLDPTKEDIIVESYTLPADLKYQGEIGPEGSYQSQYLGEVDLKSEGQIAPEDYYQYLGENLAAHLKYLGKSYSERITPNHGGVSWPGDQPLN